jgi:hypothetical protein
VFAGDFERAGVSSKGLRIARSFVAASRARRDPGYGFDFVWFFAF